MNSEIDNKIKKLNAAMVPIVEAINQASQKYRPVLEAFSLEAEKAHKAFSPVAIRIQKSIEKGLIAAQKWQIDRKIEVTAMAKLGWFPNWYTFVYHPSSEIRTIDDLMLSQIDDCWDELKKQMLKLCPNRAHIFEVIFSLHEEGNYVASIPLTLAQADGVCSEEFSHFFSADPVSKKKASDKILEKFDDGELKLNFFTEFLLEPFKIRLQVTNSSSKNSANFKSKGPNRHGILHGSRKHLDYGTKINGYKSLSFLAFLIYTTKDEFKKGEQTA